MIFKNVLDSQCGNKQAMLWLVNKFEPAIKKYARKLNSEDGYNDLVADFLESVLHINCNKIKYKTDGAMVNYLTHSIYHAYIKLMRKQLSEFSTVCIDYVPEQLLHCADPKNSSITPKLDIPKTLLTKSERKILYFTEVQGYSAAETARKTGTSRQNVSQTRARALKKLREHFDRSDQL